METSNRQHTNSDNDSDTALIRTTNDTISNHAKWRKISTVGILCFINLINYMDRFTLAGILTDVQKYFNIGDDSGGLLQTVFVISYMIFAPLFGYLGDRQSRIKIMAAGICLWSITTLVGSFMTNFGWFIFFRALVGIGEASYSTIAPTIISDLFVKDMRSKMLAIFYFAIPVGSGLGYIVGSETAKAFGSWQWGLRVTPIMGGIAVLLMLLVMKEPERGQAEGGSHIHPGSYKEDIKALAKNPSFMLSTAGFTCVAFVAGALAWWGPHFIFLGLQLQPQNSSVSFSEVSFYFGAIAIAAGIIGVPMGTAIGDALIKKVPNIHPIICGVGMIVSSVFLVLALLLMETCTVTPLVLMFFGQMALNLNWAIVADMLLYVVIPTRRSTAEAFQILVSHAFGDAGSPYLVGVISEALKIYLIPTNSRSVSSYAVDNTTFVKSVNEADDMVKFKALQYALFTTSFVELLGGALFLVTALYIVKDKMRVEKEVSDDSVQPAHHFAEDIESHPNQIT